MSKLILGTAGHIDHGKTALVRALTGIDTDRLPEEKQRGITIDLGFADLKLEGHDFGVVDVPGHEGFIRNMLAGATGMDAVLLVVAADEGVMPQTHEHLAILDLLDVRSGVVAITKSDLVDDEWTQLVIDDVRAMLRGTSLAEAPIIAVSSRSGKGLDALRAALVAQARRPAGRPRDDVFRMPIDRVFTVKGTGTVVTGTVWSGTVRNDTTLHILPAGINARIRGVQVHGAAVSEAVAGERAAIALGGIERTSMERGAVLLDRPWQQSRMLIVRARLIAGTDWELRTRQRVHVHCGTTDVLARVVLLDREFLAAGDVGWAQLRLEEPLVARAGDRLVIRSYSPVTTIGGGIIAELSERKLTRIPADHAARLDAVLSGDAVAAVGAAIEGATTEGVTLHALVQCTPHTPTQVQQAIARLAEHVVAISNRYFSSVVVEETVIALLSAADRFHAAHPLRPGMDRAELKGAVRGPAELVEYALGLAIEREELAANGSDIRRRGFQPALSERQEGLRKQLLEALTAAGLAAPSVPELGKTLGEPVQLAQLLRLLEMEGLIRAVAPDVYVESGALEAAELRTRRELAGLEGLSASEFRSVLPVSRKHLIPLLEYFDRCGITMRKGDLRSVPAASVAGSAEAS